jgi:hypothetical protein
MDGVRDSVVGARRRSSRELDESTRGGHGGPEGEGLGGGAARELDGSAGDGDGGLEQELRPGSGPRENGGLASSSEGEKSRSGGEENGGGIRIRWGPATFS